MGKVNNVFRPVAQLVEHRSPKPGVGGSIPSWPAMRKSLGRIMSKQESFKFLDKAKWLISLSFFVVAVVGNSYYTEVAFLYRVLGVVGLIGLGILFMALTDFGKSSIKLMAESRTELRRVVWPTRVETTQTFLIVFISILVLALLLWGLESLLSWLTKLILG